MTEPQTITVEHIRALLDTRSPDSIIGLLGGQVEIIEGDERDSEPHQGALEVISHGELAERLGDDAGEDDLQAQADALTTAVEQLGG